MKDFEKAKELNRLNWNDRVSIHVDDKGGVYDIPSFLDGRNTLLSVELDILGDIKGKKILHLMCHIGTDTISLSRLGAKLTGVDLSDKAVLAARDFAAQTGQDIRFVEGDVCSPLDFSEEFDWVFMSYGTIYWLKHLDRLFENVAKSLKKGGRYLLVDSHPTSTIFEEIDGKMIFCNPYFHLEEGIVYESETSYTNTDRKIQNRKSVEWGHNIGSIFDKLRGAGLELQQFTEYPFECFQRFPSMVARGDGYYEFPEGFQLPGLMSIVARKV